MTATVFSFIDKLKSLKNYIVPALAVVALALVFYVGHRTRQAPVEPPHKPAIHKPVKPPVKATKKPTVVVKRPKAPPVAPPRKPPAVDPWQNNCDMNGWCWGKPFPFLPVFGTP